MWHLGPYSQHFTFFATYEWAKQAGVFHYSRPEWLARDKHSGFLGPFKTCKENEVLWIRPLGLYSQHFTFFVTYEWLK
jgi:hypothetical protein